MTLHSTSLLKLTVVTVVAALAIPSLASSQSKTSSQAHPYDVRFIDMTIHHHRDGIAMSELEEQNGDNDQVEALAHRIREGQQKDIGELEAIRSKHHANHDKAMSGSVAGMSMAQMQREAAADMAKLKRAKDDALDHLFL